MAPSKPPNHSNAESLLEEAGKKSIPEKLFAELCCWFWVLEGSIEQVNIQRDIKSFLMFLAGS